ncbi:hypothetical protein B0H13DRAFT_2398611 [Mycena leptocephala]|nr:hypothetical protein B0H13DRAFT_2398611 [Mycena leptocephala]
MSTACGINGALSEFLKVRDDEVECRKHGRCGRKISHCYSEYSQQRWPAEATMVKRARQLSIHNRAHDSPPPPVPTKGTVFQRAVSNAPLGPPHSLILVAFVAALGAAWTSKKMASSGCKRQHSFAYGHAKKYSAATPSTNVPLACVLCPIIPPRKTPPVFWKYSIYEHIRAEHPRYWDDLNGAPNNLDGDFADKIAISREELTAFGIVTGLLGAPSAQSISGAAPPGKKRPLDDVTNATAASGSNKRVRQ